MNISNTKHKGNVVEALFLAQAVRAGLTVSQPFGDNAPYDFILDNSEKLIKVQCKHMRSAPNKTGVYIVQMHSKVGTRRCGRLSYKGSADYVFAHNLEDNVFAWVDVDKNNVLDNLTLRAEPVLNNQQKDINLLENYQNPPY